jgi:hypothetical protein
MSLTTKRLGSTPDEPHTLEVQEMLPLASPLLWHVSRLQGVKVVAKKSWAFADDFEAFFTYKDRLFVMETPFSNVQVVLLGRRPDETLFSEVEMHVRRFPPAICLIAPIALLRFFFLPFNPSSKIFHRYGVHQCTGQEIPPES